MFSDLFTIAIMLLSVASLFAGVPSAAMAVILRIWQPENSTATWRKVFSTVKLWMLTAIIVAACLAASLVREPGMAKLAIVSIYYPIWCVTLAPSFVVLATLAMNRPALTPPRRPQG